MQYKKWKRFLFNNNNLLQKKTTKKQLMKNNLEKQKQTNTSTKSYSDALKSNSNSIKHETSHVVIIRPKGNEINSDILKKEIETKLNSKEIGSISIKKFKNIANNSVLIECNSNDECESLKNKINENLNEKCEANIPEKKLPKLIIYNVFHETDENEFSEMLINRNEKIKNFIDNNVNEKITFKFMLKAKNPLFKHAVIEVTPELRKIIINLRKINVMLSRCDVEDFISIMRCFNCLGFGHLKKNCTNNLTCSQCAGSDHSHKECQSRANHKTCINCKKYNERIKNPNAIKHDINHDALYSECPSLKYIKNLIQSKINYG